MRRLAVFLIPVMLAACAGGPAIMTESAPGTDFSVYHTYTWGAKPKVMNPLAGQRLVADIDEQLQAKGWTQSPDGQVTLVAHVATRQHQTMQTFYTGTPYAGWGWRPYGYYPYRSVGMSTVSARTTVQTYDVGTLVLDMFDTKSKQAIWHGTVTGTIPDSVTNGFGRLDSAIEKLFAKFPPTSTAPQ